MDSEILNALNQIATEVRLLRELNENDHKHLGQQVDRVEKLGKLTNGRVTANEKALIPLILLPDSVRANAGAISNMKGIRTGIMSVMSLIIGILGVLVVIL